MKKLLVLMLTVCMLLTLVALPAQAEADVTLTVAWWGSQSRNEKFQAALDLYSELTGVKIEVINNGFSAHLTMMSASGATGDMPDVSMCQGAYYQSYVDSGLFLDLTPYVESGELDLSSVSEAILAATTIDGKLYGVCAGMNSPSIIYNKTLLDENGIVVPDYMSLDDFKALSAEIYEATGYRTHILNVPQWIEMVCRGNGQVLYGVDSLGVESADDLLPVLELLEEGRSEGWLYDYSLSVGLDDSENQPIVYYTEPATGTWCSFFYSNQAVPMQAAAPEGVELALTTYGLDNQQASNYLREAMSWTVSTQSKNPDAAVALVNWLINDVDANNCIAADPGVPVSSIVANAMADSMTGIQARVFDYITNVVTPSCSPSNPPAGAGSSEVISLINTLAEKIEYGEMSAAEAAEQIFTEGNRIMAEAAN